MESEETTTGRVHHGRNVRRTRIEKNIKQEVLSEMLHMSQPNVSKYENARVIEDEMLRRFAKALEVPFEYLKNTEEDAQTVVFENNITTNNDNASGNSNAVYDNSNTFNSIDKLVDLYEKMLKVDNHTIAMLEKRLKDLENLLNK